MSWKHVLMMTTALVVLVACGGGNANNEDTDGVPVAVGINLSAEDVAATATASTLQGGSGVAPPSIDAYQFVLPSVYETDDQLYSIETIGQALNTATGQIFAFEQGTSVDDELRALCAESNRTVAIMQSTTYMLAQQLCGAEAVGFVSRYGNAWQSVAFVVRADSAAQSLADLGTLPWVVPNPEGSQEYMAAVKALRDAGVEPGPYEGTLTSSEAVAVVLAGEAEFAAITYNPPGDGPYGHSQPAEPYPDDRAAIVANEFGFPVWLDRRVLEPRAVMYPDNPAIFDQTRIVGIGMELSSEALVFGPGFDPALQAQVIDFLVGFMGSEDCRYSTCVDPTFGWTGFVVSSPVGQTPAAVLLSELGIDAYDVTSDLTVISLTPVPTAVVSPEAEGVDQ